jgi:hypothetical protein
VREALRAQPGVSYSEVLQAIDAPARPSGRRKRFTDALTDTIGAITPPPGNLAIGTPNKLATANTITATPSMISRRKMAPAALVVAGIAAAMIGVAIYMATRNPTKTDPTEARPIAKPTEAADAAVAPVEPADAAVAAVAIEPPKIELPKPDDPPKKDPKKDPKRVKKDPPKGDPPKVDPPKVDPPKVDPPKVDPPKKKCPAGDIDCLYGDGT